MFTNKRSIMTLFSNRLDPYCHLVRIVLSEKGIPYQSKQVEEGEDSEQLVELNPYGTLPTLLDRDLVLYNANIIVEYLEERFPHPPLMPVYPVAKARNRLMLYRIESDWYSLMNTILQGTPKAAAEKARVALSESLTAVAPVFETSKYFLSDEFSLVDCSLAALLWRLPAMGITLPPQADAIQNYADQLFSRESFVESLTDSEREIREWE